LCIFIVVSVTKFCTWGGSISVSQEGGHLRPAIITHIDKPDIAKDFFKVRYAFRIWYSLPREIEHLVAIL